MTMQVHARQTDTAPWYKHRWPWILMSVPAASVVLGIILIGTAMRNPAILVVDNYYAEGRGINQSLEMDRAAQALGLSGQLHLNNGEIQLTLNSSDEAVRLFVYHATDNQRDQTFTLLPADGQSYYEPADADDAAALTAILQARSTWYLDLRGADNTWRLRKRVSTPASVVNL